MVGKSLLSIAFSGLVAVGALAAQSPATAPAAKVQTPERPRLVCRGGERQLSSRIRSERRCRTAEQWAEEDERRAGLPLSAQVTQGQNDGRQSTQPR